MIERAFNAPGAFWFQAFVLLILIGEALKRWDQPWAKPALAVYGTVMFWYTGDYLLTDQRGYQVFTPEILSFSFFQVFAFLITFRLFLGGFSRRLCKAPLRINVQFLRDGGLYRDDYVPARLLNRGLFVLILGWLAVLAVGISNSPDKWLALIWPPLATEKISMYPLARVGGGSSFLFNALGYVHILLCSLFGVIAAIAKGPTRWIALAMVCITWPYFWFDRYRSKMLALLLPGVAAFVLIGRRSLIFRISVVAVVVLALGVWFSRVMDYRSGSGVSVFLENESAMEDNALPLPKGAGREGQDMFKELCWINTFIDSGRYPPNWGESYLSELVNPIPRAIWPNKPLVGIDYAIARGFGKRDNKNDVFATVSTGMIGQGCVNFGPYLGVLAAAFLFALWAAYLSRLWCQRYSALRLGLFLIGMGLTFNTGRDFTLLVLFPFLFGYIGVRLIEWHQGTGPHSRRAKRAGSIPQPPRTIPPAQS